MKKLLVAVTVAALATSSAIAGDVAAGKAKYATCMGCHGAQLQGGVGPKLSGQAAGDVELKLKSYRGKKVLGAQSAMMWGIAAGLSDADIANLSAYIATVK